MRARRRFAPGAGNFVAGVRFLSAAAHLRAGRRAAEALRAGWRKSRAVGAARVLVPWTAGSRDGPPRGRLWRPGRYLGTVAVLIQDGFRDLILATFGQ